MTLGSAAFAWAVFAQDHLDLCPADVCQLTLTLPGPRRRVLDGSR
jgi:hypothetical protein